SSAIAHAAPSSTPHTDSGGRSDSRCTRPSAATHTRATGELRRSVIAMMWSFAGEREPKPGAPRPWSPEAPGVDRKSTRLNSSHVKISYAVFCLKTKKVHGEV